MWQITMKTIINSSNVTALSVAVGFFVAVTVLVAFVPVGFEFNSGSLTLSASIAHGCCGDAGGGEGRGGGADHEIVRPIPPAPIPKPKPVCSISAAPTTVDEGGNTTLSWSSSNATSAKLNQGIGSVSVDGSRTISDITNTLTYTLTVTGPGGSANCSTKITVRKTPAPTCTLSINPTTVDYNGSATLNWSSSNATSAVLDQGIGSVSLIGSRSVSNLTDTRTYTLTVTGNGGTRTCSTTVTVRSQTPTPTCSLSANPTHINEGNSTTLTWSSSHASSATINQGIGTVGVNGSYSVTPGDTTTYTLTVYGNGTSATCNATVYVDERERPSCSLYASPQHVGRGGSSSLQWSSSNASSAYLSQVGDVSVSGSRTVYDITYDRTYVLTVYRNGQSATCSTTIYTDEYSNIPSCSLYATPNSLPQGGYATLHWTTNNANSAWVSEGIGSVSVGSGNRTIQAHNTRVYTMTVYGYNGQTRTCSTTIGVYAPPLVIPNPPPQPLAFVTLTQVPYTGVDPDMLNFAIFAGAMFGSLIAGYALYAYRRNYRA